MSVVFFALVVCTELSSQRPVVFGVHWTTPTNLAYPFFRKKKKGQLDS